MSEKVMAISLLIFGAFQVIAMIVLLILAVQTINSQQFTKHDLI